MALPFSGWRRGGEALNKKVDSARIPIGVVILPNRFERFQLENDIEMSDVMRALRAAVVALALLQNPGCGDDAERRDGASRPESGISPGAANRARTDAALRDDARPVDRTIPVVPKDAPSREAEPPSRAAADSTPDRSASIPSVDEIRDSLEAPRTGEDPRLVTTLDPEVSAERVYETQGLDADGDDLDTLLDTLASDPDPAVRAAAADMLAETERSEAIDGLLQALEDPSPEVVVQALETLALVGTQDILPAIKPLLDSDNDEIREAAEDTDYFVDDSDFDES